MSRTTKIVLGVSLALNLLFVGFALGQYSRGGPHRHAIGSPMPLAWALHHLPEARRDELRPELQALRRTLRPDLRAMRDARRDVETALLREPLDPTELQAALTRMQSRMRATENASQAALVRIAGKLTHAERAALVEALRAPPWRGPPGMRASREPEGPGEPPVL